MMKKSVLGMLGVVAMVVMVGSGCQKATDTKPVDEKISKHASPFVSDIAFTDPCLKDAQSIQQYLGKIGSPLSTYKGENAGQEAIGAQIIELNSQSHDGGEGSVSWKGISPKVILAYLQQRWDLLDQGTFSSEQIDQLVEIALPVGSVLPADNSYPSWGASEVPATLMGQVNWMVSEIERFYVSYWTDHKLSAGSSDASYSQLANEAMSYGLEQFLAETVGGDEAIDQFIETFREWFGGDLMQGDVRCEKTLSDQDVPVGLFKDINRWSSVQKIQNFLEQRGAPLAEYTSARSRSASEIIVDACDQTSWKTNPELILTYLQWRWGLLDNNKVITSQQIDDLVKISTEPASDYLSRWSQMLEPSEENSSSTIDTETNDSGKGLQDQLYWLAERLYAEFISAGGSLSFTQAGYDDRAAALRTLDVVLRDTANGTNSLVSFVEIYQELFGEK